MVLGKHSASQCTLYNPTNQMEAWEGLRVVGGATGNE